MIVWPRSFRTLTLALALVSGHLVPALSVAAGPQDPPAGAVPTGPTVPGAPFTITRSQSVADALVLNWDRSCLATDTDYQVYEGALGNFTSHAPVLCSTGGATSVTITATPGNRYYLIVPHNGANEGSYGTTSAGSERPLGVASCRGKSVASCQSLPACGDGVIDPGEACDDFNTSPGDGCSDACLVEPGYTCTGQPSVCTPQ